MKIGLGITTYNSEAYFSTLFNSIPDHKVDEIVVVNGGDVYTGEYKRSNGKELHWIQHTENKGPAQSRNDAINKLVELGCDYIFLSEDDMIIKSENIFDEYIRAHKVTGLSYFCFVSYPWEAGPVGDRTPRLKVEYDEHTRIHFYKNSCNEFTFRTKKIWEKVGPYDTIFKYCFDVDDYYKITKLPEGHVFWYSPDIADSDNLIMNNPDAVSRLDGDGKRHERTAPDFMYFMQKYGMAINQIPDTPKEEVLNKLRKIALHEN